jgi:hypothetical protein
MGELKKIIGIEISHTENTITISQQCYTKSILKCENSTDCNLISTSMDLKIKSQHLNGTKSYGITYSNSHGGNNNLFHSFFHSFTNTAYANTDYYKSTAMYVFTMYVFITAG